MASITCTSQDKWVTGVIFIFITLAYPLNAVSYRPQAGPCGHILLITLIYMMKWSRAGRTMFISKGSHFPRAHKVPLNFRFKGYILHPWYTSCFSKRTPNLSLISFYVKSTLYNLFSRHKNPLLDWTKSSYFFILK